MSCWWTILTDKASYSKNRITLIMNFFTKGTTGNFNAMGNPFLMKNNVATIFPFSTLLNPFLHPKGL
jgi:hypothetical protein